MGTKGSYSGGGGKAGKDLRQNLEDWLDSLPGLPGVPNGDASGGAPPPGQSPAPAMRPAHLLPTLGLFRPRSGGGADGPGAGGAGGGTGGGSNVSTGGRSARSVAGSSRTAGRAAAAAYALRSGNAGLLRELGLDYARLVSNPDLVDVARQIMVAACGPLPDGTIEDDEQRVAAAKVAEFVLEAGADGAPPTPEEIVRESIAVVIFEAFSTETAAMLQNGQNAERATAEAERLIRQTAQALAFRARLSPEGPTPAEFAEAIAEGLETMRDIWGKGNA